MSSLKQLARIVDDRRNWPTFVLAGALVFIGLLILDALDVRNGFTVILLVSQGLSRPTACARSRQAEPRR